MHPKHASMNLDDLGFSKGKFLSPPPRHSISSSKKEKHKGMAANSTELKLNILRTKIQQ
jgi:hypothetical protein